MTTSTAKASWKYLVPNAVTATNMMLGVASLLNTLAGQYQLAGWLILLGVIFDKLDGSTARFLKASSRFGVEFDSLADLITFGMAPAGFVYAVVGGHIPPISPVLRSLLAIACGAYVLASATRLARFNLDAVAGGSPIYFGVAMPMGAALVTTFLLVIIKYHGQIYEPWAADLMILGSWHPAEWMYRFYSIYVFAVAALMVSDLKIPKPKPTGNRLVNAFLIINFVAVYITIPLRIFPEYLALSGIEYVLIALYLTLFNKKTKSYKRMTFMDTLAIPPTDED
ncbi:MAG: CDP-alcohol phosphatidyltransferase family protein [Deltaproteobacteria bacterium]|nr:CDP-alcohol phosphatidyltransferase family protein [Deltaproteobacteria bacterium]